MSRRRVTALILLGLLALAVCVVTYLPAGLAAAWVEATTPLRLSGVSGTMLHGRAAYVSLPNGGIDNLRWDVEPAALLDATVAARLRMSTDIGHLRAEWRHSLFGGTTIRRLRGWASLRWLARLGGETLVPVSARVGFDIQRLSWSATARIRAAQGRLRVRDAHWQLMKPPLLLGGFVARLGRQGDAATLHIVHSHGPLRVRGHATLTPAGLWRVDARLRAEDNAPARLQKLLEHLGAAAPGGWRQVVERGSF